ncbi:MAG: MBOAT family protein [Pseudomonadota bacterium]
MVFASLEFLMLFFPLFLTVYALVGKRQKNLTLMLASWIFYGWWSPMFLSLLVGITILVWIGGLLIERASTPRRRGWVLGITIGILVLTLAYYKYINLLVETLNGVLGFAGVMPLEWQHALLPIGLSFIVLQGISYLVDVYRRTVSAEHSFISFAAYKAMFSQLIAGPIIRYEWVHKELHSRPFDWVNFGQGARRFMIGMSMKVLIADTLAPVADAAFALSEPSFADAWIGNLAYTLQLFFDFAGYSAMAIGIGQMLGFTFPENFNNPYVARSIQDFWRRWHISLGSWLRDYLYIPLGGSRVGPIMVYVNLFLVMAISGLWHGADSWNFLLWGVAHGIAMVVHRAWHQAGYVMPAMLGWALTLLFVMLAWTLFRAPDFASAMNMYSGQFGLNGWGLGDSMQLVLRPAHLFAVLAALFAIALPLVLPWLQARVAPRMHGVVLEAISLWPLLAFLFSFALIASRGATPFLYFQF